MLIKTIQDSCGQRERSVPGGGGYNRELWWRRQHGSDRERSESLFLFFAFFPFLLFSRSFRVVGRAKLAACIDPTETTTTASSPLSSRATRRLNLSANSLLRARGEANAKRDSLIFTSSENCSRNGCASPSNLRLDFSKDRIDIDDTSFATSGKFLRSRSSS